MPPNFQNGKIYAIRSHQTDKIYIGSTIQPLYKRFHHHKCKPCSSGEILKYPDAFIELLENYACSDKNELHRREGELIRLHNCVNKQIAGRTPAEWQEDHKDEMKQYREEHKDEKQQYDTQYRIHNNQTIKEQKKQYYLDNNQTIKEHRHQKYNCFCTGKYTNNGKSHHFKSKKHLEFIRQLSA
jgi:hypothetical protein